MIPDPRLSRRQLLRAGAGGALGLYGLGSFAGCTVSRPIEKPESTAAIKPEIDGDILLYNWAQYMDPDIKKRFSEKFTPADMRFLVNIMPTTKRPPSAT